MTWIAIGGALCALSVACGAFGAHALAARLEPRALEVWETGSRYLMYSGLGTVLIALTREVTDRAGLGLAAGLVAVGGLIFFATLAALALGAPRGLGMITPLGGALMIAGFVAFAWLSLR